MSTNVSIHTTNEISKEMESILLNLEQHNIQKIDKTIRNAESDSEVKFSKTEEVHPYRKNTING